MKLSARVLITNSDFLKANRGPLYHRLNITVTFRMHLSRIIIDSLYDHLRNADDQRCRNRCISWFLTFTVHSIGHQGKGTCASAPSTGLESVLTFSIVQQQTWPAVCNIAASRRLFAADDSHLVHADGLSDPYFEACCIVRSSFTVSKSPDFFRAERALLHFLSTVHSVHLNSQWCCSLSPTQFLCHLNPFAVSWVTCHTYHVSHIQKPA